MSRKVNWPDNRRFAFTIVDDTDHATVARVKPIYDLLHQLNLRTTKTVWVAPTDPAAHYAATQTLEDPDYRDFILDLQAKGFEIALHGVRGDSTERSGIEQGLNRFQEILGHDPATHVNHAHNRDNLYWGVQRFSAVRRALHLYRGDPGEGLGGEPSSPHFWGDLAGERIRYVRADAFRGIDTLKCDPFMPWHDPWRPHVRAWFSCSDGGDPRTFVRLLAEPAQDRLERQGGLCVVYTHFALRGFVDDHGRVHPNVRRLLTTLSRRNGWFAPAGVILDHLAGPDGPRRLTLARRAALLANRWMKR